MSQSKENSSNTNVEQVADTDTGIYEYQESVPAVHELHDSNTATR